MTKQTPIITGIPGQTLNDSTKKFIQKYKPHGIILFKHNIDNASQLHTLTQDILCCGNNSYIPTIFIDQEGGRVQRIKPPLVSKHYPSARSFGELYLQDKHLALKSAYKNYYELTEELKNNYGIRGILAPVIDLLFNTDTNVIGDRSFSSSNPDIVVELAIASLKGIKDAGGLTCIKHIPGHGRAQVDSHHELPLVNTSLQELMDTDFKVCVKLNELAASYIDYAMTAHILYTCIHKKDPITTSVEGIKFLREDLGFKCKIISDDIDMGALSGTLQEKFNSVLSAGCDIAIIGHTKIEELDIVISDFR